MSNKQVKPVTILDALDQNERFYQLLKELESNYRALQSTHMKALDFIQSYGLEEEWYEHLRG